MSATTYLELSETGGGAHKFYEVRVVDTEVTITYGRIGEQGQVRTATFADNGKALKAAEKKIGEKVRKGYAPAVKGERARRPVSRREIVSTRSTARQAPVLWRFASGAPAFGIFVGDEQAWVGNENGDVYTLTHDGRVTGRFGLPDAVKCIVADDFWIYAGCDDGNVYDLGAKVPRVAYEIANDVDIYWLDIHDGVLGVSDRQGGVTVVDHEDEFQWSRPSSGDSGWMVRNAADGVYHGHSRGVTHYSTRGEQVWHAETTGSVLFGWQERAEVFAGTSRGWVHRFAKSDGQVTGDYRCDAAVFSCATSPDGEFVFAGDNQSSVYCFAADGTRLWKLGTGCGSAYSMQYRDERLYLVTTDGSLACVDASPAAVHAAEQGTLPDRQDIKAGSINRVEATAEVEVVTHVAPGDGVLVECVQVGGRVRVHVLSDGYDRTWGVQFPKHIRVPGARYVVSEVLTSASGSFYRARGEIKRIH
ncbi:WGR domain-containing protein [Actinokineospora globicatena]|uniref:WGR domain-containing protein n=1 Tax=Actinokineospora globicatena TaxID=103729 RepID=UPI0020A3F789|nr:WGR domain-containing protein [Actinokineospora globicatena]MCP2304145.1 WGR domain-containing protein, predicted DNA-binding domain in MolR [Actinokineospora globicatena]GLW78498.1 molybdenum metabolism regulator [Actinokineospora globicatena]GLW84838.1 molybdenum metabolism regulator [Actinokineospora globicatena]